jgi:hypothetical protein
VLPGTSSRIRIPFVCGRGRKGKKRKLGPDGLGAASLCLFLSFFLSQRCDIVEGTFSLLLLDVFPSFFFLITKIDYDRFFFSFVRPLLSNCNFSSKSWKKEFSQRLPTTVHCTFPLLFLLLLYPISFFFLLVPPPSLLIYFALSVLPYEYMVMTSLPPPLTIMTRSRPSVSTSRNSMSEREKEEDEGKSGVG